MILRIRELRQAAQMQQKEFAAKLGVSCPSVHEWETDGAFPTVDKLPRIAAILNCTIDDLFQPASIIPQKEA